MSTAVVRDQANNIIGDTSLEDEPGNIYRDPSAETIVRAPGSLNQVSSRVNSAYDLTVDNSFFSRDVDYWIGGDAASPDTALLGNRTTAQRSTWTTQSLDSAARWCVAAMVLPFIGLNHVMLWGCTPSTVLNTAEVFLTQLACLCARARSQLRRLAREQAARDVFAAAMDLLLIIYAFGFMVLTMYEANIIGH